MLWLMPADLRRQRIGMMFISIDASAGAARSAAAADTTRTDCRRLVHGRQMSGGKGAKGGNLESAGKTGPADDAAKRRKSAETGGNSFLGPCSGAKVFPEGLRETPNSLAETAETPETHHGWPGTLLRLVHSAGLALRSAQREARWRMGWDSNPRCACTHAGFQDRCLKPLGHPSKSNISIA